LQLLGLTRLVFGTAGDFRLFPTMPPIVDIDGIITVEDVMQELIGEEMPTDDNGSRMASNWTGIAARCDHQVPSNHIV
jgi:hypothetical protein